MCVSSDGLIAATYGPYSARQNDAKIVQHIMNKQDSIFNDLKDGDVIVVDRGFRDSVRDLKRRSFQVILFESEIVLFL